MSVAAAPSPPPAPAPLNWTAIGFIFALIVQSAGTIWWAASLDRRTAALEQAVEPLSSGILARMDERSLAADKALVRIEQRLDRLEPGQ